MGIKKIDITCLWCKNNKNVYKHSDAKFCNYKCYNSYHTQIFIDKWIRNETNGVYDKSKTTLHKRIKKYYKNNVFNCEICNIGNIWNGKNLVFEIDHIDGDRTNNYKTNLRYICPNCHSQTETFRIRNAKKNRPVA